MSNKNQLLITRPEHDPGTRYLSYWGGKVIEEAKKKNFNIADLRHKKVNRKEFEGRIQKLDPSFIFLNGHGNAQEVMGDDNQTLVKLGENHKILKNRVTYAVACNSAQKLGKTCADKKTTYIGYKEAFIFNIERNCLNHPQNDKRATKFLDATNKIPLSLIKGHTAEEATDNSIEHHKKTLRMLLTKPGKDPDTLEDIKDLWWNMTHLVCLGNKDTRI